MASSSKSIGMMTAPVSTQISPVTVTSFGPAGTPHNLRESGANILDTFCNSYPNTEIHSLLPEFFGDNITELMEPKENLSGKEKDEVRGRTINQTGEGHELVVFNIFVRLIRQKNLSDTLLIMRTFEMDTKNPMNMKRRALLSLLPNIDFKRVNTEAENDFVILVKNLGVVLVEVKGSTKDNMVRSAEKQLANLNRIVQCIMKAMTNDKKRAIPTVKLLLIPDCTDKSPSTPTPQGTYFVFEDECKHFDGRWEKVIDELRQIKSVNSFSDEEFEEVSQILVGIWSAKAVCMVQPGTWTYELKQKGANVSRVKQLKKIDKIVDTGNIRNENQFKAQEQKLNPLTKIVRTNESDIFRSCNGLKLCYLTPHQRQLFSHLKQAVVRSAAGCGKSLLILFKTLEIVSDPASRVLLLAPEPHNLRIRNTLCANNVSAEMIEEFSPPFPLPPPSCKVFVMDVNKFFKVERNTLMSYDMRGYHFFVDDLQHLDYFTGNPSATFMDVIDFIDQTYTLSVQHDTYLWIMLDVVQGWIDVPLGNGWYPMDLFMTRDKQPRVYNIPIATLSHVMRNTENIMKLSNEARAQYLSTYNKSSYALPCPQVGHKVTSCVPVCHKLQMGVDKKHVVPFIISRLREVLGSVTKPPFSLPLSNIAIIYDYEDDYKPHKSDISSFLINEFDTIPQTIEEQLTSNNRKDIVMDAMEHIMSFETPMVIFLSTVGGGFGSGHYYRIGTRARVSLTVIDVRTYYPPDTYNNMDVVLWRPDNSGEFTKCTSM